MYVIISTSARPLLSALRELTYTPPRSASRAHCRAQEASKAGRSEPHARRSLRSLDYLVQLNSGVLLR